MEGGNPSEKPASEGGILLKNSALRGPYQLKTVMCFRRLTAGSAPNPTGTVKLRRPPRQSRGASQLRWARVRHAQVDSYYGHHAHRALRTLRERRWGNPNHRITLRTALRSRSLRKLLETRVSASYPSSGCGDGRVRCDKGAGAGLREQETCEREITPLRLDLDSGTLQCYITTAESELWTERAAMMFDLNDLCQTSGVTARTVRYYVQQGLLPSPGLGTGARYSEGHLARLRLIRRLQSEHLPLAEIRRRLEALDDDAVRSLLEAPAPGEGPATTSAVDYVRGVLGGPPVPTPGDSSRRPPPLPLPAVSSPAAGTPRPGRPAVADRAQWERISLAPDIELHVRRPLSREDNRRVEKLLEKARELFRGEEV